MNMPVVNPSQVNENSQVLDVRPMSNMEGVAKRQHRLKDQLTDLNNLH